MNTTRHGKIARLPREIREQLNVRMENGEAGHRLAVWLNELPEVRRVLAEDFGGGVINEQNLTNWRWGGHQDWRQEQLVKKHCVAVAQAPAGTAVTLEQLTTLMTARYLVMMRDRHRAKPDWEQMRTYCRDVYKFRQVEIQGKRVELEWEKLEFQKECLGYRKKDVAKRVVQVLLTLGPEVRAALAKGKGGEHSTMNIQRPISKDGGVRSPAGKLPVQNLKSEARNLRAEISGFTSKTRGFDGSIKVNQGLEFFKNIGGLLSGQSDGVVRKITTFPLSPAERENVQGGFLKSASIRDISRLELASRRTEVSDGLRASSAQGDAMSEEGAYWWEPGRRPALLMKEAPNRLGRSGLKMGRTGRSALPGDMDGGTCVRPAASRVPALSGMEFGRIVMGNSAMGERKREIGRVKNLHFCSTSHLLRHKISLPALSDFNAGKLRFLDHSFYQLPILGPLSERVMDDKVMGINLSAADFSPKVTAAQTRSSLNPPMMVCGRMANHHHFIHSTENSEEPKTEHKPLNHRFLHIISTNP